MKSTAIKLALISIVLLLNACAGKDFVRMNDETLMLGKTTQGQIKAALGKPYQTGVVTKNEKQLTTASYAYAATGGKAAAKSVIPARSQGFYFLDNILVGYEFTSSFQVDSTNFDGAKVAEIKKGTTTRDEVVKLLGNPGGKYTYPLIPNMNQEAVNYLYSQTSGSAFNLKFYQKQLVISFDPKGIVSNVEYTESGQK
jgi:outer membrane protein assembly factor BamE (lipoprotein component of BamABCDE complex)